MRSSLELLLLSLVQDGIGTPYELKMRADISLGSTVPALGRLKKEGLLKISEQGSRRSHRYSLTAKGVRVLRSEWSNESNSHEEDLDSIVRVTYLKWIHASAEKAVEYLKRAVSQRARLAAVSEAEASRHYEEMAENNRNQMRWLRATVRSQQLKAEADVLSELSVKLESADKSTNHPGAKKSLSHRKQ